MNSTDQALWTCGLAKLETAPATLTEAELEVLRFYGSDRDRARIRQALFPDPAPLVTKAAAPPAPRPAASKAWVKKAFEAYTKGMADALRQALQQRDARIKVLEDRLVALEADQAVKRELVP